ncbi:MAG: DnaJ family domain-containing protein [Pseudomonadota bacterium]
MPPELFGDREMSKLRLVEDEIGRKLAEAHRTGELQGAESYGKPMPEDAGWEQTPQEFRMGFKVLKNAGVVPPEVELFNQRAKLRQAVAEAETKSRRNELQAALSTLEQKIALRLEALRVNGSL